MLTLVWMICIYLGPSVGTEIYVFPDWETCQTVLHLIDTDGSYTTPCYQGWAEITDTEEEEYP